MIPNIGGPELIILLVLIAIVVIILLVVSRAAGSRNQTDRSAGGENTQRSSARQVLDERYARGEIGREEYERVRHDIEG